MRAISSDATPPSRRALTKACFTASTSSWESETTFFSVYETWLFTLPSARSPASLISPALYFQDEMS